MNIQWFPGHMAKTKRMIEENRRLVDAVVELLDARLPRSSQNPDIQSIVGDKPTLTALNKSDLADPSATARWLDALRNAGRNAVAVDALHDRSLSAVADQLRQMLRDRLRSREERGMTGRPIKLMIVGVPNVGKSAFLNKMAGRSAAETGDRPGVTRGKQWVRLKNGLEALDTPGVLWPRFDDERTGLRLAFVGSIRDEILDAEELASRLLDTLKGRYFDALSARYRLDGASSESAGYELLERIGRKRGFVVSGGEVDLLRAANVVLDEFRAGKLGRITLELPGEEETEN